MISYNNAAPKAVNNVGQFGATEGSIGAYKSAAEYAADAKYWALLSQTKYSSVEELLAEVERLYAQGRLLEEDIEQLKTDFETQQQELLGLIQSTGTAIDNTNAATELSKEATQQVLAQLDIISNMTVRTTLLPPGSLATGSYDNTTGVFSFGIPEGQPGRDGTDGTISDIGSVAIGVPASDDYSFYVDKDNGGLYRTSMVDIANLVPSIRSISINGGEEQTGAVSFNSVSSFNSRTGIVWPQSGDYTVEQITGAAKSGANSDITSISGLTTALSIEQGGTGATSAEEARANLGLGSVSVEDIVPLAKGGTGGNSASSARTNLGLGLVSTESIVPIIKGGTGSTSAETARLALVAAKSGDNYDITSINNLTTALSVDQGGTGVNNQADLWSAIRPTGATPLSSDPVDPLDAVTKQWTESITIPLTDRVAQAENDIDVIETGVVPYINNVNPQSSSSGLNGSTATTRKSVLINSVNSTSVQLIPSYYDLSGIGFFSYRADRTPYRTISKSGNSTYSFVNSDKAAQVRDAVVGVDPVWVDGRWPQQATFEKLAILGDRSSPNECGLFLFQGSYYKVRDTTFSGCKRAVLLGDVWVSEFTNLQSFDGAFISSRGTSQRWSGCWSAGNADVIGAYSFTDTTYTTLTSCASDHSPRTAYFFQNGCEVTMVSCGTEFPTNTVDNALGTMIALNSNNKVTSTGFKGVPNANQTQPLISVGVNDMLHLINWNSHQTLYPNSVDISINGDGSTVIVEDSIFSGTVTGNIAFPRVNFRGDYQNSKVVLRYKQNEYVYICPPGGGFVNSPEPMFTNGSIVPTLLVNNAVTTGFTYSDQTGFFTKNGNVATYHFYLRVESKTGIANAAAIKISLLDLPATVTPGAIATGPLIVDGTSSFTAGGCYAVAGSRYLYLYSQSRSELTGVDVVSGTQISGSISFYVKDTGWK